jgi:ketol-acid reductoisomerase
MDWMYANCSTTAQRGALDWRHDFRKAVKPVFDRLYKSVASGKEAEVVLKANSAPNYKAKLDKELSEMKNSEMWKAGVAVRSLRPERASKANKKPNKRKATKKTTKRK